MSGRLKIYKVLGEGFVIGEELERTKENIWLRYPSVFKAFPGQEQGEFFFKCIDLVPKFFDNFESMIKKFPLKRNLVYMESGLNDQLKNLYDSYLKDLTKRMMNIDVVGEEALNHLPPAPDGRNRRQ